MQRRLRAFFREGGHEQVVAVAHEAARKGRAAELPEDLPGALREALLAAGIHSLHGHQRAAFDLLRAGEHVVVSTGTASGKSLCYQLAVLDDFARDPQSRALLLFPTKALAQDQARKLASLKLDAGPGGAPSVRPAVPAIYDGDTPSDTRAHIRRSATILLSNPDMLHLGILPGHERWAEFLHHLRFVVLDEAHVYRGVFGSHVAQVVRRLRRLCAHYGSDPLFVLTSATIAEPQAFAERLVGVPFAAVDEDQAPRPERTVVFWNPPLEDPAAGTRRSALAEASYVAAETVLAGARVIAFAPTRKAAELIYGHVRRRLEDRDPGGAATRVQPYRAGYTPQQRRDIERRLFAHELDAVIATQALELGIDVGSLDVSLVTGFPGTVTSLRQRWGRAGRTGHGWAVLVAGQDALDQYFMREPELLLSRRVEEAIIDLHNPHISARHLEAAAYERPLTPHDEAFFGEEGMLAAGRLADAGRLRRHRDGLVWSLPHSPAAETSLRTAGNEQFVIVETRAGEIIGTVERERVYRFAHPGAVYLHLGRSYLVTRLDLEGRTVLVEDFDGTYYTQVKVDKNVLIAGQAGTRTLPGAVLFFGEIEVTEQVIAYQKRDMTDQHIIDTTSLDLPEQTFITQAFWLAIPGPVIDGALAHLASEPRAGASGDEGPRGPETVTPGSLHGAEHALIALLPLYAMCDRWDIGGLSTPWHWQTDTASIFVYDGYPGGIGLSKRGYEAFESLAADARALIAACPCESGLPQLRAEPQVRQPQRAAAQGRFHRPVAGAVARSRGPGLGTALSLPPAPVSQADRARASRGAARTAAATAEPAGGPSLRCCEARSSRGRAARVRGASKETTPETPGTLGRAPDDGFLAEELGGAQAEVELHDVVGVLEVDAEERLDAPEALLQRVAVDEQGLGGRLDGPVMVQPRAKGLDQPRVPPRVVFDERRDGALRHVGQCLLALTLQEPEPPAHRLEEDQPAGVDAAPRGRARVERLLERSASLVRMRVRGGRADGQRQAVGCVGRDRLEQEQQVARAARADRGRAAREEDGDGQTPRSAQERDEAVPAH